MSKPRTALIVGTGKFGRHYVRILSRLENAIMPKAVAFHRLILTRTSLEPARKTASALAKDAPDGVVIIGEQVDNEDDLDRILERYQPDFTCIVAKDPKRGNRIHAGYSVRALAAGVDVLCEKPFSEADGTGSSLTEANQLIPYDRTGRIGLELPFAAVRTHTQRALQWESRFLEFGKIEFFWGTQTPLQTNLFNELAVHPWSLIPDNWSTVRLRMEAGRTTAVAAGMLQHETMNRTMDLQIRLSRENRFRGFRAGSRSFGFRTAGTTVQLIELDGAIEEASLLDPSLWTGRILLKSENPLRQNIIASLLHQPITDVRRTINSQIFLEMGQGYRP